jgi:hypothetical protein
MAYETTAETQQSTDRALRGWGIITLVIGSLVGVPAALLAEFEFGLLAALGLSGNLALGLFAMIPGFTLGAVALVVMLGT